MATQENESKPKRYVAMAMMSNGHEKRYREVEHDDLGIALTALTMATVRFLNDNKGYDIHETRVGYRCSDRCSELHSIEAVIGDIATSANLTELIEVAEARHRAEVEPEGSNN